MGSVLKVSLLNGIEINKLIYPIVFCVAKNKIPSYVKEYKILSVNEILSQKLLEYETDKRKQFVEDELNKLIDSAGQPLLITDFEILFHPEYQIDVLKLFIMANRRRKLAVIWCGRFEDGYLRFAEAGYVDYKSFNIKNYDITCII